MERRSQNLIVADREEASIGDLMQVDLHMDITRHVEDNRIRDIWKIWKVRLNHSQRNECITNLSKLCAIIAGR